MTFLFCLFFFSLLALFRRTLELAFMLFLFFPLKKYSWFKLLNFVSKSLSNIIWILSVEIFYRFDIPYQLDKSEEKIFIVSLSFILVYVWFLQYGMLFFCCFFLKKKHIVRKKRKARQYTMIMVNWNWNISDVYYWLVIWSDSSRWIRWIYQRFIWFISLVYFTLFIMQHYHIILRYNI